jgi:dihydropteroate synthase
VALVWRCGERRFDLSARVLVMGVVNLTPDSFSDGGRYLEPAAAIARGRELLAEGADVLDLGAESTRPGAEPVPAETQLARLLPAIAALRGERDAVISVDTASAQVAERCLAAGAAIVNDVTALRDPAMAGVVRAAGAGLVMMHLRGTPANMQDDPRYDDVTRDVAAWFEVRLAAARRAGLEPETIAIDPGIGFGKTAQHNFELLARIQELRRFERPIAIGVSRKSFLGRTLGLPVDQRLEGGLAATAVAVFEGASIVRTHDVRATSRAVRIAEALRASRPPVVGSVREF